MGLEDSFHQAVEEWIDHCRSPYVWLSSSSEPVRDCEPYRNIVSMGYKALPLIRQLYEKDSSGNSALSIVQGHGLLSLVEDIVGKDFSIPEDIFGRISEMKDYTKEWLDKNSERYVSTQ